ncbi:MAG: hypothetical protein KDB80_14940, partial [Planctomycetes bacterium]|nr:hypothetical protein [Planctomycetota bacterium]
LTKCELRNLYVMPVFWDDHCYGQTPCTDPDYADPTGLNPPYESISHWTPNPGQAKIDEFAATNFTSPEFIDYVTEVAQIGATSPALLMWDAMNEPSIDAMDSLHQRALIDATLTLLKKVDPSCVTTVGFIGVIDGEPVADVVRNPDMDVISIHPYGTFRENVHLYCKYAAQVLDGNAMEMDKPLLLTECGQPGRGQGYQDILQYVKEVTYGPLSDPNRHQGCGFFVFSAMCGWENGNFPHRDKHGIFFHDGEVRELDAVLAFEQFAIEHGVDARTLTRQYVQKRPGTPGWFPQLPLELGHDYAHTRRILFLPQWYYGALSLEQGHEFADLFDIIGYDAAVVSVGPTPASTVTVVDLQLFALISQIYRDGNLFGTPLTLQQRNALLDAWRYELLRHVGPLTGAD